MMMDSLHAITSNRHLTKNMIKNCALPNAIFVPGQRLLGIYNCGWIELKFVKL